jgi:hypothetical protein
VTVVAARREVVKQLQGLGLSERRALRLVSMSASTLRYRPRDDGNGRLRERLTERSCVTAMRTRLGISSATVQTRR